MTTSRTRLADMPAGQRALTVTLAVLLALVVAILVALVLGGGVWAIRSVWGAAL